MTLIHQICSRRPNNLVWWCRRSFNLVVGSGERLSSSSSSSTVVPSTISNNRGIMSTIPKTIATTTTTTSRTNPSSNTELSQTTQNILSLHQKEVGRTIMNNHVDNHSNRWFSSLPSLSSSSATMTSLMGLSNFGGGVCGGMDGRGLTTTLSRFQSPLQHPLQHHPLQQHQQQQYRFISKYISKSAKKRLPMSTKRAGKGYYKGNRSTKEGTINSKGRFIVHPLRRLQLIVPDGLNDEYTENENDDGDTTKKSSSSFALKPYVSRSASKVPPEQRRQ